MAYAAIAHPTRSMRRLHEPIERLRLAAGLNRVRTRWSILSVEPAILGYAIVH
jgi:hypothetical protein